MAVLPGNIDPCEIEKTLNKMFSPEWLRETAAKVGYVQRERKIDPATLFWVLVLGFGVGAQRTLASLSALLASGLCIRGAPSSWKLRHQHPSHTPLCASAKLAKSSHVSAVSGFVASCTFPILGKFTTIGSTRMARRGRVTTPGWRRPAPLGAANRSTTRSWSRGWCGPSKTICESLDVRKRPWLARGGTRWTLPAIMDAYGLHAVLRIGCHYLRE